MIKICEIITLKELKELPKPSESIDRFVWASGILTFDCTACDDLDIELLTELTVASRCRKDRGMTTNVLVRKHVWSMLNNRFNGQLEFRCASAQ